MKKAMAKFLTSMTIFGTIGLCVRHIGLSSAAVAFVRGVMGSLFLLLFMALTRRRFDRPAVKKNLLLLLLSGGAIGINWLLLFEAYRYTTVSVATLSYYFAPVLVTVACPILFRERLTKKQILCFAMSTLGLVLITGIGADEDAIAAGLEQIVQYIEDLHFDPEDIENLRGRNLFSEEFLAYLADFKFTGDIWAVPEGTVIFPGEPIMTVRAPSIEAQFIETYVLMVINHQSLIATKASRIARAAKGRAVSEFGSRRAQGADGAILGARAAYIGGCSATACTISERDFAIPATGTMAHSWVQMFDSEYEAFKTYCEIYPNNATLIISVSCCICVYRAFFLCKHCFSLFSV
mgnify:CR=1 FL=1